MTGKLLVVAAAALATIASTQKPDPVAAPLNGSTVVGKLCVSALSEMTLSIFLTSK